MARYFHQRLSDKEDRVYREIELLRKLLYEALKIRNKSPQDVEDAARDIVAALVGREVEFGDLLPGQYPNGIKCGQSEFINEEAMYDGLPPMLTQEDYDQGNTYLHRGAYYPY